MPKGFKAAKKAAIEALVSGNYQHEARNAIEVKNLLATGEVSAEFVADLLRQSRGSDHSSSPHHRARSIEVHVVCARGWYIKFYFIDPDTFFISVHQ